MERTVPSKLSCICVYRRSSVVPILSLESASKASRSDRDHAPARRGKEDAQVSRVYARCGKSCWNWGLEARCAGFARRVRILAKTRICGVWCAGFSPSPLPPPQWGGARRKVRRFPAVVRAVVTPAARASWGKVRRLCSSIPAHLGGYVGWRGNLRLLGYGVFTFSAFPSIGEGKCTPNGSEYAVVKEQWSVRHSIRQCT
jgi:hypothetical protein